MQAVSSCSPPMPMAVTSTLFRTCRHRHPKVIFSLVALEPFVDMVLWVMSVPWPCVLVVQKNHYTLSNVWCSSDLFCLVQLIIYYLMSLLARVSSFVFTKFSKQYSSNIMFMVYVLCTVLNNILSTPFNHSVCAAHYVYHFFH